MRIPLFVTLVTVFFVAFAASELQNDPPARQRELPPISKKSTKAEVQRHFHLGSFSKTYFVPGGLCYEYERPGWSAVLCIEGPAPSLPHPEAAPL